MKKPLLLWIDLEMTGLDENVHHILEVAAIVTNIDFEPIDNFHEIVFQTPEVLSLMDDWCQKTHGESGLTKAVSAGKTLRQAEDELIRFINKHFGPKKNDIVIAGNTIYNDRKFIEKYMPLLTPRLHYRMVDVSSFKEIFRNKYKIKKEKKNTHRALEDIQESIDELKLYLSYVHIEKNKE